MLSYQPISSRLRSRIKEGISDLPASKTNPIRTYNHVKLAYLLTKKSLGRFADNSIVNNTFALGSQRNIAVQMIHELRFEEAKAHMKALGKAVENVVSEELYLFAKQMLLSAEALYYYKIGELDLAWKLSVEGIAMNEYLTRKGCFVLVHRCTELNVNLSKVLVKKGSYEEGIKMYGGVLSYLAAGKGDGLRGTIFSEKKYWTPFPCLREDLMLDNFKSMCFYLIDHRRYREGGEKVLFDCLFGIIYIDGFSYYFYTFQLI